MENNCKIYFIRAFVNYTNFPNSDKWAPCINTRLYLWNVPFNRKANIKEHLKLQGFPTTFKQVVSVSQLKKQIGNSISVNVLMNLFKQIFKTI